MRPCCPKSCFFFKCATYDNELNRPVIDKVGDVSVMRRVDCIASVAVGVVQIEEIRVADDVVIFATFLRLIVVNQLAQVGRHVSSSFDVLSRLHSPASTVRRLEDAQVHLTTALNHAIATVGSASEKTRQHTRQHQSRAGGQGQ